MNSKIEKMLGFRRYLLEHVSTLTVRQYNEIPAGFNNNIIWNITHLLAVQQMMCYVRSGLPVIVEDRFITPFLSGTKPEAFITDNDIEKICALLISTVDRLQDDLEAGIFVEYSPSAMIPKVYGFSVGNIHEALEYLLYHEGLHAATVLSLKRLVLARD